MIGEILMIGLFVLLGIMLSLGKWSFLIAGFNTLPKEEQNKYDVLSLCKFMGKVMFSIAFSISLFVLSDLLEIKVLYNIGLALSLTIVIFAIVYANTGNRFKKR